VIDKRTFDGRRKCVAFQHDERRMRGMLVRDAATLFGNSRALGFTTHYSMAQVKELVDAVNKLDGIENGETSVSLIRVANA
jgi:hypothetical protein